MYSNSVDEITQTQ